MPCDADPKWYRPAADATLFSGLGVSAGALLALSLRGKRAALGMSTVACLLLLTSLAISLAVSFTRARRLPEHDRATGAFAPALAVAAAHQAARAEAEEELAEADAAAAAAASEDAAAAARRTEEIDAWGAAPKGARRFFATPGGAATPHPQSVNRVRAPRGAFTDTAARVAASLHNPGGELGPTATFSVLKPYAPPDIDGGASPGARRAERASAAVPTPAQRDQWDELSRARALDRLMERTTLDTAQAASLSDDPMMLPLDGRPPPMR